MARESVTFVRITANEEGIEPFSRLACAVYNIPSIAFSGLARLFERAPHDVAIRLRSCSVVPQNATPPLEAFLLVDRLLKLSVLRLLLQSCAMFVHVIQLFLRVLGDTNPARRYWATCFRNGEIFAAVERRKRKLWVTSDDDTLPSPSPPPPRRCIYMRPRSLSARACFLFLRATVFRDD